MFTLIGKLLSKRQNYVIISTKNADIEVFIPEVLMSVIDNISNGSLMCVQGEIREYHSFYAEKLIILEEK